MRHKLIFSAVLFFLFTCYAEKTTASSPEDPSGLNITADMQFNYAQKLFDDKDYPAAQVEFKRFIRFFPQDPRMDQADYSAGVALFYSKQFYEAAKWFDRIIRRTENPDDQWARNSYFMQSQSFEAMGNMGFAQIVLQNFLKLTRNDQTKDRIYMELSRIHIKNTMTPGIDELGNARRNLTLISPDAQQEFEVSRHIEALDSAVNAPSKSPALAGVLAIIPGGGMLYCQRYKDALASFCLNTGLIWAAWTAFDHDNPALGAVITFVETGFYSGNIYGSITAAHKYNKAAQIRILNRAFNLHPGFDPLTRSFSMTLSCPF